MAAQTAARLACMEESLAAHLFLIDSWQDLFVTQCEERARCILLMSPTHPAVYPWWHQHQVFQIRFQALHSGRQVDGILA